MKELIKTFLVLILLSLHIPNLSARSYDKIIQSGKIRIGINLNMPSVAVPAGMCTIPVTTSAVGRNMAVTSYVSEG